MGDSVEKKHVEIELEEKEAAKDEEKAGEKLEEKKDENGEGNTNEVPNADNKDQDDDDDAMDTDPPKAELTEDEKKTNFYPQKIPDLTDNVMASCYADFT